MNDPFAFDAPPEQYIVVGNPIRHSQSPFIHQCFARQTGERIVYEAMAVDQGGFAQALGNFQASGGKGMNVTVPFKRDAWKMVDQRSARAQRAGAVNTIKFLDDGKVFGDNTDGIGLVRDLKRNLSLSLKGRKILLLGAGGAARGVIEPLLECLPASLSIANRTVEKAVQLASEFAFAGAIRGLAFPALSGEHFDLIINATSASLSGTVPDLPEGLLRDSENTFCYDMMYAAKATPFMRWAEQQEATAGVADGLGMLVEQAAEAFLIWRGILPETAAVIKLLRQRLLAH